MNKNATRPECIWVSDQDSEQPQEETQCGEIFEFTEGGILDNNFKFCPYCGGAITGLGPDDLRD